MTTGTHARYPGAQPFADDELSSRIFFGRRQASTAVVDRVLANRLLVIYAKSGVGKTSLLCAGVAPRLRQEGYLPLTVRVNDVGRGPLASALDGIRAEASRQDIECIAGSGESLWSFFRTVEFWRGDLLLIPVLIVDQFEELFTLQDGTARAQFLSDLGYLIRGVAPPGVADNATSAPTVRVVLSLREDYLGMLEEAADDIPEILDCRFRLTPLSIDAAREAMTEPAAMADPLLSTQPFSYDSHALSFILGHLSDRRAAPARATRYIEPFYLQLVCQRVETLVAAQQRLGANRAVTLQDLGGLAGLESTLIGFYTETIRALPKRRIRTAVHRLCEELLISAEGRRLSLEEAEIQRQLMLSRDSLRSLVAGRLLRSENRTDSTYYELSHDALVEPVLATRRTGALATAWLRIGTGGLVLLGSGGLVIIFALLLFDPKEKNGPLLVAIGFCGVVFALGHRVLRSGLWARRRYARRTAVSTHRPILQVFTALFGSSAIVASLSLGLLSLLTVWRVCAHRASVPPFTFGARVDTSLAQIHGIALDALAECAGLVAIAWLVFVAGGGYARRVGIWPRRARQAAVKTAWLLDLAGAIGAVVGMGIAFGVGALRIRCSGALQGHLPAGLPANLFYTIESDCSKAFAGGSGGLDIGLDCIAVLALGVFGALTVRRSLRVVQ